MDQTVDQLLILEKQLHGAELKLLQARTRTAGYKKMTEDLDISKVHTMTSGQLKNEIRELDLSNQHLSITYDALMNELETLLQSLSQQQIENILYENTKIKLERAGKRLDTVKSLANFVSESLTYDELVWIMMQLDLEKVKSFCDNETNVSSDAQACTKRIESMLQYKSIPANFYSGIFVSRMADQLVASLQLQRPCSAKACLYEYERFCRLSNYKLKGIVEKKHYSTELRLLDSLKSIEKIYSAYVFDGPIDGPMFENVKFLEPIYEARRTKEDIEKMIRRIRCDIQANITDKMHSDRFWRFQQVLWIWFLTEPKKVIQAIEEARKAASKISSVKMLAGIKRKESEG
ncbi:unnamed protein product [Hermetia illucens]|uniref:Uncharacterized protein n=2 Tax=Hermetia illucens TaxID=343691 RepID=A0A7R8U9I8_HERIL|nr:unnamed protein product [Hermetia illucens]